jgi:hypothetical protein
MTKFNAINNTKILTLTGIFAVFAVAMVTGPLALNMGDNTAFAKSNHKDNDADQSTEQGQYSDQNSQCVSGESIVLSCNNLSLKEQANDGNSASGQQGGDRGSSNDADQSTEQEQDSDQNAQCVSGEDAIVSCNNAEFQNLVNSGNRALAQD